MTKGKPTTASVLFRMLQLTVLSLSYCFRIIPQVIISMATHLYFDHPYEPSSLEPGLYWATRFTDTRKVFSLKPDRIYENIDVSRAGNPLTYNDVCGRGGIKCDRLRKQNRKNIIGKVFFAD